MIDLINKWKQGLERTRKATFGRLAALLGVSEIDDGTWEDLEALLLQSDLGVETTREILQSLRQRVQHEGLTKASELKQALREELLKR